MNERKKIIMGGDSMHVTTGYGGVKANVAPFIRDLNHEVLELGIQNTGNPHMVDGIERLPNHRGQAFAANSMIDWINERDPDLVWYIGDPHWFDWLSNYNMQQTAKDAKGYKSIVYFPIDNDIFPENAIRSVMGHDYRVTFTQYGKRICNENGVDDVRVIPHGVDTNTFFPLSKEERADLRARNGLDDKFVVGQVNRNNFRKQTPLLMAAFAEFAKDKDDAMLFLHCDPRDSQGFDLIEYVRQFNLQGKVLFNEKVKTAVTGVSAKELNLYYNVMDVHASATTGEGWGLTTTEAQSAGTPVVIGDHTTGPELVKNNGWLVPLVDDGGWDSRIFTQQGGHYYRIQFNGLVNAFEDAYADREKTRKKGQSASRYVRGQYAWPKVNQGWKQLLEEILNE